MQYRTTIAAIIICLAMPAAAEFQTASKAYEIALEKFSAPLSLNGAATFRQCKKCKSLSVRVTAKTQYFFDDRNVTLKEFKKNIFSVPNRSVRTIVVIHHLESDTIEEIHLTL